jgi:hypothetical protein
MLKPRCATAVLVPKMSGVSCQLTAGGMIVKPLAAENGDFLGHLANRKNGRQVYASRFTGDQAILDLTA